MNEADIRGRIDAEHVSQAAEFFREMKDEVTSELDWELVKEQMKAAKDDSESKRSFVS